MPILVILAVGNYNISSGINFNVDGSASNPIVWRGTISASDYLALSADGTNSTVL